MAFERLPNELILHLFEYLSFRDLFYAVDGLNQRLNRLLRVHFHKFHLDFRSISKTEFEHICQHYLGSIRNQITSLYLSNDEHTPWQIQQFLSRPISLHQLTRLQCLSITRLQSKAALEQIMIACASFPDLRRLEFSDCDICMTGGDATRFYNYIWKQPQLTHCHLDISFAYENYFPDPTVTSNSLRYLRVQHTCFSLTSLVELCERTPNLERLSTSFEDDADHQSDVMSPVPSLVRLKIEFRSNSIVLKQLLKNLPNLRHLTITTYGYCIRGDELEEIITRYLPNLKVLRLKLRADLSDTADKEEQMNALLNTYRTKFWIEERRWFVRCHWYASGQSFQPDKLELFTLPYTFDNFYTYTSCVRAKSTSPLDDDVLTCNYAKNLYYQQKYFTNSILSTIRLQNIEHLSLSFPLEKTFFTVVANLQRLTTLYVFTDKNAELHIVESQLQDLLDRASHLRKVIFGIWGTANCQVPSMQLSTPSVRCLDMQGYTIDHELRSYDAEQCLQLTRSPLGMQCQTLLIKVDDRNEVPALVNNMPYLRALILRCADDVWADQDDPALRVEDDLIIWLRAHLPSTCVMARDESLSSNVRIWIR